MAASHEPSASPQSFVSAPLTHVPLSQLSPTVQYLPSSQELPFAEATMTHVLIGPSAWPVLHTASAHCAVSISEQSSAHGEPPPAPPPPPVLLLLLVSCVSGSSMPGPHEHPVMHMTESRSNHGRKCRVRSSISP